MARWGKLSVKHFMKQAIFFLIFIIFVGCAQQKTPKPAAPVTTVEVVLPPASEAKTTNTVSKKVAPAPPKVSKKIDYDAINKSILKDVSKKIVDKASKKD